MNSKRSEWKYLIDSSYVPVIVDFLKTYGAVDRNSIDGQYKVTSLYLETPDWWCYHAKKEGLDPRFKLRWRWYGEKLFRPQLEMKKRAGHNIYKVFEVFDKDDFLKAVNEVSLIRDRLPFDLVQSLYSRHFKPVLYTHYNRHAYSFLENFRVTIDTHLQFAPYLEGVLPNYVLSPEVVLEVKGEGEVPEILMQMIDRFKLKLISFSKYQLGVEKNFYV